MVGQSVDTGCRDAWRRSLSELKVKHLDPEARPRLFISDDGHLHVGCGHVMDTRLGVRRDLTVASVRLEFHPGDDALARKWFAAAWTGYMTHESLESIKYDGKAVLDPHEAPYPNAPCNRGLKDGFPPVLSRESFERTLRVVMEPVHASALMKTGADRPEEGNQ